MMILDLDKDNYGSTFYLSPPQLYFYVFMLVWKD